MQSILKELLLLVYLGGLREFNQGQILYVIFPGKNKQTKSYMKCILLNF